MGGKDPQNSNDSPVGEIDTRAPFESVKAALSLFGPTTGSGSGSAGDRPAGLKKTKTFLAERVLAKETRLQLAQKELNKYKEQLENAETTKAQALDELEKAKSVVEDLTGKLQVINESKESAIKATQAAKDQASQLKGGPSETSDSWKQDLDTTTEEYTASITELNAAKQELTKIRQDFEASMEAKAKAYQKAAEAEQLAKANKERIEEIRKEIAAAEESIVEVKHASDHAQQEHAKILSEKEAQRQTYKASLEELQQKLTAFKTQFDPDLKGSLEAKLAETTAEIEALQKQPSDPNKSSGDSDSQELNEAKAELMKLEEQESELKSLVESLTQEFESAKKEHSELKEKQVQMESIAADVQFKLDKSKAELKAAISEAKAAHASDELNATLQQLGSESENAKKEAEEMKNSAEELRTEAEATRVSLEEAEEKLEIALKEAEEAKLAEIQALEKVRVLSEQTTAARAAKLESGGSITISKEEFESLNRRVEESDILAEMKVAAAMAQVEAVRASENEAQKKLETRAKEIEGMKSATEEANKKAEMADAAKKVVESELQKWYEQEQKKTTEIPASPASPAMILADTEASSESSSYHDAADKSVPAEHASEDPRRVEKSPVPRRALFSSISGIFHRRKSHGEGASLSHLSSEKSM